MRQVFILFAFVIAVTQMVTAIQISNHHLDRIAHNPGIMDFVMPVREANVLSRALVEAIVESYAPPRMFFIGPLAISSTIERFFTILRDNSFVNGTELMFRPDETLFEDCYGLTKSSIEEHFMDLPFPSGSPCSGCYPRGFGWWFQQLVKLGAADALGLSQYYVVWDSDLVGLAPLWALSDSVTGRPKIAILQAGMGFVNDSQYRDIESPYWMGHYGAGLDRLLGIDWQYPIHGGTYINHHMVFDTEVLHRMFHAIEARMTNKTGQAGSWILAIIALSHEFHQGFSEFLTYASYCHHLAAQEGLPHDFYLSEHPFGMFPGFRIQDEKPDRQQKIVDGAWDMVEEFKDHQKQSREVGLSLGQARQFFWSNAFKEKYMPVASNISYVQLDHMPPFSYGEEGGEA